ncbi:MAG: hypothetical protein IPM35_26950 [Myxococcales bacterium]|nr:hypothetical protein [Myxococcales bacterium]
MYRDELSAFRERYAAARSNLAELARELADQRELVETLSAQLGELGLSFPRLPDLEALRPFPEARADQGSAELVRLAFDAEKEAERLIARRDALARLAQLMNRRLRGEVVALPLGAPPRSVPWTYALAEFAPSWIVSCGLAVLVAGGFADASVGSRPRPEVLLPIAAGVTAVVAVLAVRARRRVRFLGRCRDAVSTNVVSSGHDGSNMTNWPVLVSKGWDVSSESYSGDGKLDVVEFLGHDGQSGRLTLKNAGYDSGVVLYDPETLRAFDVKELACTPQPDAEGRWLGSLPLRAWIRALLFVGALAAGVVYTGLYVG